MIKTLYKLKSEVLVYSGMASWRFLVIPKKEGEEIKKYFGPHAKGWGSIPVKVTIGKTEWKTSLFPDKKKGSYLLPLKAEVRKREGIGDEGRVEFVVKL